MILTHHHLRAAHWTINRFRRKSRRKNLRPNLRSNLHPRSKLKRPKRRRQKWIHHPHHLQLPKRHPKLVYYYKIYFLYKIFFYILIIIFLIKQIKYLGVFQFFVFVVFYGFCNEVFMRNFNCKNELPLKKNNLWFVAVNILIDAGFRAL